MTEELGATTVVRRSGDEPFSHDGAPTPARLLDFWRWSSSDLLSNATRGVLAEYVVGLALGCVGDTRREWDAADLVTHDGVRVEVKSAAYVQTWAQSRPSRISFGIQPTTGWDAATNTTSAVRRRQADVYVFALLAHRDQATIDPLDLDQWTFYVVPTSVLDQAAPHQKSISLSRLVGLADAPVSFADLLPTVALASSSRSA